MSPPPKTSSSEELSTPPPNRGNSGRKQITDGIGQTVANGSRRRAINKSQKGQGGRRLRKYESNFLFYLLSQPQATSGWTERVKINKQFVETQSQAELRCSVVIAIPLDR